MRSVARAAPTNRRRSNASLATIGLVSSKKPQLPAGGRKAENLSVTEMLRQSVHARSGKQTLCCLAQCKIGKLGQE
jgi:hypothetical protein